MSDKIKKLAEQAGCTYTVNNAITTKHNGLPIDVMEKFAELIIKECINQAEQAKNSPFVSLDDANRMKHFVDVTKKKIVKHFGIGS